MENDEHVTQSRPGSHWNPRVAGVASEALFVGQGWGAAMHGATLRKKSTELRCQSKPVLGAWGKVQFHWNSSFKVARLQVVGQSCSCLEVSACEDVSDWLMSCSLISFQRSHGAKSTDALNDNLYYISICFLLLIYLG